MLPRPKVRIVRVGFGARSGPPSGTIVSSLTSDVEDKRGFNYFHSVNTGRKEVRPVKAKTLAFESPRAIPHSRMGGETKSMARFRGGGTSMVFTKRARAFAGWNLTGRALSFATVEINQMLRGYSGGFAGLPDLANRIIGVLTFHIVRITPRKSGKLARSYEIQPAGA